MVFQIKTLKENGALDATMGANALLAQTSTEVVESIGSVGSARTKDIEVVDLHGSERKP